MKMSRVNERYTKAGLEIYNEYRDLYFYLKALMRLNKILKVSKPIINENKINSTTVISNKPKICILKISPSGHIKQYVYYKAIVAKYSMDINNLKMEGKLADFY